MANHPEGYITDEHLLEQFYKDGNNEWLGKLLHRYTVLIYGVCVKYLYREDEARDAVQQVFYIALREIPKYKIRYFKSWLYAVARNHCLMNYRKNTPLYALDEDIISAEYTDEEEIKAKKIKELRLSSLESGLRHLHIDQYICLKLFYLDKKTYLEISHLTGFSISKVKTKIQNGKRSLKMYIKKFNLYAYD